MNHMFSSRRWVAGLFAGVLLTLALMSALTYIVDPYFQFRVRDHRYLISPQYVNGGLIRNYDYDTLIVGSSMTQNFDMDLFRQNMNVKPLHVSLGGMTRDELLELIGLAGSVNKAKDYYVCIDSNTFTSVDTGAESKNIPYLMNRDALSVMQYLLSHEAWFYSLPVDLALCAIDALGISLPQSIAKKTSIDMLGNWESNYVFGEDEVLANYKLGRYAVSEIDMDSLHERAQASIDGFFSAIADSDGRFHFFFPPYSGLYWYSERDKAEMLISIKHYFVEKAAGYGHVVYDFQGQDFIGDLNNYKDLTHYSGEINDWMVEQFANGACVITPENFGSFEQALKENVQKFAARYAQALE